jgi:hypothetical protein
MNYLKVVAFGELCAGPVCAAHDFAVEFDGETFGGEREMLYEVAERQAIGYVACLAVDDDVQVSFSLPLRQKIFRRVE